MNKKRRSFPMEVRSGSAVVKMYQVENKGRLSFTLSYFSEGHRKLKMCANFDNAHSEAKSIAKNLAHGELDVLELRSADRIAYVHAVRALRPTRVPLELAAKEYAQAQKILGGRGSIIDAVREYAKRNLNRIPQKPIPDAVTEMLEIKAQDGASKEYLKVLRVYLIPFADAFHCSLLSVSTPEISDFLRALKVSPRSRNNARQTIGAFFKFCRERGWLPKEHDGISLVPKFKESAPGEIEIFTPGELSKLLTYARQEMIPFLAIGAFSGLRSAEIERLDWNEVRIQERFIEVKAAKSKTARRRLVPILDNLAAWLAPYAEQTGRVAPFLNMNKQIAWLVRDTNAALKETAKGNKPKHGGSLRWKKNGLRHSFISYRVADIQNVNQIALECGNSPAIIFRHYRELVRPAEAEVWFSITPNT